MEKDPKLMMIKELMQRNFYSVDIDSSIFSASVLMASKNIGILPVVKRDRGLEGLLVGIINDRDIVTRCIAVGRDPKKTKVSECMTPNPIRIVPSATCDDAVKLMTELGVRRLPVVERDRLVGIISLGDVACVSTFCPNKKSPDPTCMLIDFAKELSKSSPNLQGSRFQSLRPGTKTKM